MNVNNSSDNIYPIYDDSGKYIRYPVNFYPKNTVFLESEQIKSHLEKIKEEELIKTLSKMDRDSLEKLNRCITRLLMGGI
ncbi:MAG: hypothetical protein ACOC33_02615 [bacterium]